MAHIQTSQIIPAKIEDVYSYLINLTNIPESLSDSLTLRILGTKKVLVKGEVYRIELERFGIKVDGSIKVEELIENDRIEFSQLKGHFQIFRHTARISKHSESQTLLVDYVEYQLPLGIIGRLADDLFMRKDLKRILESRYLRLIKYFQFNQSQKKAVSKSDTAE